MKNKYVTNINDREKKCWNQLKCTNGTTILSNVIILFTKPIIQYDHRNKYTQQMPFGYRCVYRQFRGFIYEMVVLHIVLRKISDSKSALKMKHFCAGWYNASLYSTRYVRSFLYPFPPLTRSLTNNSNNIPYSQFHRQALFRIHTHLTFSQYPYVSRSNDKFVFNSRFVQSNLWQHHIQNPHS